MAVKNYIATQKGYIEGRIIQPGEAFSHDFKELVRDMDADNVRNGVYPIKRDKNGEPVFKAGKAPMWVELADPVETAAANAADNRYEDVNVSEMSVPELRAHAAGLPVDVTALKSKEDILAVIAAWNDPRR